MTDNTPTSNLLFQVITPLGFLVRVTQSYWDLIVTVKHPSMVEKQTDVQKALKNPEMIRSSRQDSAVYLFYIQEKPKRWLCAVVKRLNGDGFLITTYVTDAMKEGEQIWPK